MFDHLRVFIRVLLVPFALLCMSFAQNGPSAGNPPYLDTSKPINVRVDDLVSRMTLEEKASQVVNQARAIPRLQVPAYDWWSEALHGVANAGTATVFPSRLVWPRPSTRPLIHEMAIVIGTEARAKHNQAVRAGRRDIMEGLDFWSPNINIFRDPRWGRGQETYGEDPFLTGRMGVAFVTGLQGDDPEISSRSSRRRSITPYTAGPSRRATASTCTSRKHDMEDTYLPAFRATVTEGKAESVMCAYNRVNGEPACANTFLLSDQLRGAWKFDGYVVSDCDAIVGRFHRTPLHEKLGGSRRGLPEDAAWTTNAPTFSPRPPTTRLREVHGRCKARILTEKDLDIALKRLFTARFRLGMFDPPEMVPYAQTPESEIDSAPHRALALKAAQESIVLLKNDGVLPFTSATHKIAVVGPLAESTKVLHGNYSGTASHAVTALEGIRKQFGADVAFSPGTNFLRKPTVIPTSALSTSDGQPGLKGEYFADGNLAGTPTVVRVDSVIDLQLTHPEPAALIAPPGMRDFSARWPGLLTPSESGTNEFGLVGSMHRLWLDGRLIADDLVLHDPNPSTKVFQLEMGHRYAIKIEYARGGFGTKLVWLNMLVGPDCGRCCGGETS